MKNKVVKYWPVMPANGNLQYWDGEQWIVIPIGSNDQYLMTHSTTIGPTWEYLGPQPSSSSAAFSSSSSSSVPEVAASKLILMNDDTIVPSGLVVCDGTKDTPDIDAVQIVGAGSSYSVGGTGGDNSVSVPGHTHSGSTHSHPEVNPIMSGTAPSTSASLGNQAVTAAGQFHSHTLISKTSGTGTMALASGGSFSSENRPAYLDITHVIPTSPLPTGTFARGATSFYAYWNDTAGTVPSNCLVCDGTDGTPDLRNKFIRNRGTESIGITGGSTTKSFGSHSHSVTHAHVSRVITTGLPLSNNQAVAQYLTGAEVSQLSHSHTSISIPASSNYNESMTGNAAQNVPNIPQYYGLTIIELSEALANWLPSGSVVYCNSASAPGGWKNCDGTSGTENFTDKFARGIDNPASVGNTGGEDSSAYPSHSHGGASHTHDYSGTSWGNTSTSVDIDSTPVFACSAASHLHNTSGALYASGSVGSPSVGNGNPAAADNKPPYHVLQAIKKV